MPFFFKNVNHQMLTFKLELDFLNKKIVFSSAKKICFSVSRQGRISRKINLKFFGRLVSFLRTISQAQHELGLKSKKKFVHETNKSLSLNAQNFGKYFSNKNAFS
jgi:hypothetical protein